MTLTADYPDRECEYPEDFQTYREAREHRRHRDHINFVLLSGAEGPAGGKTRSHPAEHQTSTTYSAANCVGRNHQTSEKLK
jgi:hypothetical protein